jgi:hypothetical protein
MPDERDSSQKAIRIITADKTPSPAPKVRRLILHMVVFFVSTALSIILIEGLTHILGPRFSHSLDELNTEATTALKKLQPWELASQYWRLVTGDEPQVCEISPSETILEYSVCRPNDKASYFNPMTYIGSIFLLLITLFLEPVARSIMHLIQLIAGGTIAIVICRVFSRRLSWPIMKEPNWLWWLFAFSLLTIACTTLLSIPILAAIWFVTVALRGIVGTPEASIGAISGSATTVISIFSARSFEAGMHEFVNTGFKRVVGRWLH